VTHPGARGGDSRTTAESNVGDSQKAAKPRRAGSLLGDQPISSGVRPWRAAGRDVRVPDGKAHEGRRGEGRAIPVREKALEGRKPRRATLLWPA
jgi:hypothetical protein